jgi:hypothetical protein
LVGKAGGELSHALDEVAHALESLVRLVHRLFPLDAAVRAAPAFLYEETRVLGNPIAPVRKSGTFGEKC